MQENVEVSDIVLLCNSDMTRSFWPLAQVIKVHPPKDELMQSVVLKLPSATLV